MVFVKVKGIMMITLLYLSAQRANVEQNEHSSAGLADQHN